MSPARGPQRRLLGEAAAVIAIAALSGVARAAEPADRGISLSAWAGGGWIEASRFATASRSTSKRWSRV